MRGKKVEWNELKEGNKYTIVRTGIAWTDKNKTENCVCYIDKECENSFFRLYNENKKYYQMLI